MKGKRYPLELAKGVAAQIVGRLGSSCSRIEVVGSVRRGKPEVGDVEVLFVSKVGRIPIPGDLFGGSVDGALADVAIREMTHEGLLIPRPNSLGRSTYGPKNKLMIWVAEGLPVDLFAVDEECWFSALVCRTGPASLNKDIAARAIERGLRWNVYGCGFSRGEEVLPVRSEREVFEVVGLCYLEPEERS